MGLKRLSLILVAFLLSFQLEGCGGVEVAPTGGEAPSRGEAPGRGEVPSGVEAPSIVETIRVLVVNNVQEVTIDGARYDLFTKPAKSAKSPKFDDEPGRFNILSINQGRGALPGAEVFVNDTPVSLPLKFTPLNELIEVNGTLFRGTIEVLGALDGRGMLVIDELPLESYLAGLINSEISSKWPREAIKAQAVAARTYALSRKLERRGAPYHLTNTNMDQVYSGADAEDMTARSAVQETSGEALWFAGAPALALYHSNGGGRTEAAAEVWVTDYPYLRSVESPYDRGSAGFAWEVSLSAGSLMRLLVAAGYNTGEPVQVTPIKRSPSGRVKTVSIADREGSTIELSGEDLRKALGYATLRSTLFSVSPDPAGGFTFRGRGSGHGVGMSQWGAKGMAERGSSYKDILEHYYPGTRLEKAY